MDSIEFRGRERREGERVIAYWRSKMDGDGELPLLSELSVAEIDSEAWSHRFVIALDERIGASALLFYGQDLARQLDLQAHNAAFQPIKDRLPERYRSTFLHGCGETLRGDVPVQLEGTIMGEDGSEEMFRAAFTPVASNTGMKLAMGAFSSKVVPAGSGVRGP